MSEDVELGGEEHPLVTVADKIGHKVTEHLEHNREAANAAETVRKMEALQAFAAAYRAEVGPALRDLIAPALENLPDDHPSRKLLELFMSPTSDIIAALTETLGIIGAGLALTKELGQIFAQQTINLVYPSHADVPLSPVDAAALVQQSWEGNDTIGAGMVAAQTEASLSGVNNGRFEALTYLSGTAPSPQDLFELFRREIINLEPAAPGEPSVWLGLQQGNLKNYWVPYLAQLAHTWLTPLDFVRAAVQDQMTQSDAEAWAGKTGLDITTALPGGKNMFSLAFDIAGRPPGPEEAGRMANRGIIDWTGTGASSVSFQQVIAESDVKTKYTKALQALQEYVPPPRMIGGLLEKGGITEAQARTYWKMGGVPASLVDAYVYEATQQATIQEKNLAKGETLSAYFDRIIDKTTATELLHLLGYSGQVAAYMLDVADYRRELKALNAEVNRIGGYYMHYKITEVEAEDRLNALGVPTDQIQGLLSIWSVDRIAPVRIPTVGQISKAVQYGTLSQGEALAKLETLGYTPYDAAIVLSAEAETQIKPLPAQSGNPQPVV